MLTYIQEYLGLDATSSRRQSDNWVLRTTRGNHACQTKIFRTMYTFPLKQRRKIIFYLVGKNSGLCPRCHLPTSFVLGTKKRFQSQGECACPALFSTWYNSRKGRECSSDLYPAEDKSSGISNSSSEIPPMISWLTKLDAIKKKKKSFF